MRYISPGKKVLLLNVLVREEIDVLSWLLLPGTHHFIYKPDDVKKSSTDILLAVFIVNMQMTRSATAIFPRQEAQNI